MLKRQSNSFLVKNVEYVFCLQAPTQVYNNGLNCDLQKALGH